MTTQFTQNSLVDTSSDEECGQEEEEEETYMFQRETSAGESPSKRLKVDDLKAFKTTGQEFHECFSIELVKGGYELISLEKEDGDDGFYYPIREAMDSNSKVIHGLGLVTFVHRRVSPTDPSVSYKEPHPMPASSDATPLKRYPRGFIVRAIETSNTQSRKEVLKKLAKLCNRYHRSHPPKKLDMPTWTQMLDRASRPRFVVEEDYDRTPKLSNLRKLNHYVIPMHIVNLIYNTFSECSPTWAEKNPQLARMFFSRPYPPEAVQKLGYVNRDGLGGSDDAPLDK